jgi:hypothetical protein
VILLRAGRSGVRLSVEERNFSLQNVQPGRGAHPDSCLLSFWPLGPPGPLSSVFLAVGPTRAPIFCLSGRGAHPSSCLLSFWPWGPPGPLSSVFLAVGPTRAPIFCRSGRGAHPDPYLLSFWPWGSPGLLSSVFLAVGLTRTPVFPGTELTTHLHLMPRLRMSGAIPLFHLYALMEWTGKTNFLPSMRSGAPF